jgi:hypothetical protein
MFGKGLFTTRPATKRRPPLRVRHLESRDLPSAVTVNFNHIVQPVRLDDLGANLVSRDTNLNTSQTAQMAQAAGLGMYRLPGGSIADTWHFEYPPTYKGEGTIASMAQFIASVKGSAVVSLDYGSGSPQEAAALLAYLDAKVGDTTVIGMGKQWNDSAHSWVPVDWRTAGYWSGLRAAQPLAHDDGLNFLRLGQSAPFNFQYFEVGNEVYGTWETDHHGSGGDPGAAHDPATYVAFAKQFGTCAQQIAPTISIGFDVGSIGGFNNWNTNILQQSVSQGFTPGFLSDHSYMQQPGSESDSTLLLHTVSDPNNEDPNNPLDWSLRAAAYRNLLNQVLGTTAAAKVQLLATEYNSVLYNAGKQSTSLVNGLFVADSIGSIMQTEYRAAIIWDLRGVWSTGDNNSSSLYGWRQGGDYGLLGDPSGPAPSTGTYIPNPSYFAEQLCSEMILGGTSVVQATSYDSNLSVYAVKESDGHLDLLVINKSPTAALTGRFDINGFQPSGQAQFWQYGKVQDTAQSKTTDGHSALHKFTATLTLNGADFSYVFPSYSMTVIDLTPAPPAGAAPVRSPAGSHGVRDGGQPLPAFAWIGPWPAATGVMYAAGGSDGGRATLPRSAAYASLTPGAGVDTTCAIHRSLPRMVVSLPAADGAGPFAAVGQDPFGDVADPVALP